MNIMEALKRLLAPIQRRISNMVKRTVVLNINDKQKMQLLQVSGISGETLTDLEHFQDYGLAFHPHKGSEAICLNIGGNTSRSIIIKVADRRYRLQPLKEGEVAMYTDEGDHIHFKRDNEIHVKTSKFVVDAEESIQMTAPETVINSENVTFNATGKVKASTPLVEATNNVTAAGDATVSGFVQADSELRSKGTIYQYFSLPTQNTMAQFVQKFNEHKHNENNPDGAETEPTQGAFHL